MQERLHIDELKRVEKSVITLLKSWQKLNKNHAKLEEKYALLSEELEQIKTRHQQEIDEMTHQREEAERIAAQALSDAVEQQQQQWQQKYDTTCSNYEEKLQDMQQSYQSQLDDLQQKMMHDEQVLRAELAQVTEIKNALCNRVLGVEE